MMKPAEDCDRVLSQNLDAEVLVIQLYLAWAHKRSGVARLHQNTPNSCANGRRDRH